jgi:hypothetical protein
MKNLAIVFSTFKLSNATEAYNTSRQNEYAACLEQFLRVLPDEYEAIFVDNSIESLEDLNSPLLKRFLESVSLILTSQNFGQRNKGVGELAMLVQASQVIDLSKYNTISYCTGRKFFTCPYPFEKSIQTDKSAVVSNPDFLFLNGEFREVAKGMFNDMFFSMKSETMLKFIKFTAPRLQMMESLMINSETNLFQFISENNIDHLVLGSLGIVRNEQKIRDPYNSIENFHIC